MNDYDLDKLGELIKFAAFGVGPFICLMFILIATAESSLVFCDKNQSDLVSEAEDIIEAEGPVSDSELAERLGVNIGYGFSLWFNQV